MQVPIRNISEQHMNMLQTPHTLEGGVVLKPQDMRLRILKPVLRKPVHKSALHKILNQRVALARNHSSFILHRDGSPRPDDNMRDPLRQPVRPVVAENLVVCGVGKGDRVFEIRRGPIRR